MTINWDRRSPSGHENRPGIGPEPTTPDGVRRAPAALT
ncbi:hypothetical protein ACVWZD_003166 [Streptomyces sp. TE3672]